MEDLPIRTLEATMMELLPPIDEVLAERGEPLSNRPHRAAMLVVEHCIVDIQGDSKEGYLTKAWFGSILSATIDWYFKIYGQAMRTQEGTVHSAAILIRQTPFAIRIPLSTHTARAADSTFWIALLASVQSDEVPLSWIVDPPTLSELSEDQRGEVAQRACMTAENVRQIWNVLLTADHISERARRHAALVLPHLESTARLIVKHDALSLSSAIWDANFAAEQIIKCFLLQDGTIKVPASHDVKDLHNLAKWSAHPPQPLLDSIALMPSGRDAVRYRYSEMGRPSLSTVIGLYEASQTICRYYALALPRKFRLENARFRMRAPPMPERQ